MNGAECRPISGGFTCNPCPHNVTGDLCQFGKLSVGLHHRNFLNVDYELAHQAFGEDFAIIHYIIYVFTRN